MVELVIYWADLGGYFTHLRKMGAKKSDEQVILAVFWVFLGGFGEIDFQKFTFFHLFFGFFPFFPFFS